MTSYIALLRGINVGGHNKISMKELQVALTEAGFRDVRTYIQSGNILFKSPNIESAVADGVRHTIADAFGLRIPVVVRTAEEWADVAERQPFPSDLADLSRWYVTFFDHFPKVVDLDPNRSPGDSFVVVGREAHLYLSGGVANTKLSHDWFEKQLDVTATARNWNTVLKLRELARA
jgi:uncharacterized protein (DUF1697 family)